jgi:murein L,D-transpeptidase YcbB/YkuD
MRFQPSNQHLGALAGYGAAEPTAESMPVIKVGATDAATNYAVTALAGNLNAKTYAGKNPSVLTDVIGGLTNPKNKGVFTPGLDSQVKKFQSANNLKADGIVGPGTWKALGLKSERKVVSASAPAPKSDDKKEETAIVETKLTDKVWFWPVTALAGAGALTLGIVVWKRRRAAAQ